MRERSGHMRRNFVRPIICIAVLLYTISLAMGETNANRINSSSRGARLIVQRAPNFGTNLIVQLSIDGKRVADIPRNQHYGGIISAGHHLLTVRAMPNTQARRPTSMRLTVRSGQVYIFTAMWEHDHLVLRRSNTYSPTRAVGTNPLKGKDRHWWEWKGRN
jgi:hypothetical protein